MTSETGLLGCGLNNIFIFYLYVHIGIVRRSSVMSIVFLSLFATTKKRDVSSENYLTKKIPLGKSFSYIRKNIGPEEPLGNGNSC